MKFLIRTLPALALVLVASSTPAVAQISVSAPEVTCSASEFITVPVVISDAAGQNAIAFSFRVQYDNTKISVTGADKDNTLAAGFNVVANPKETELIVSAASAQPLSGEGTLVNLTVNCLAEGSSPLTLNSFRFNEGNPSASTTNGLVTVEEETGEVQINLQINPGDVQFGEVMAGETVTETLSIVNMASSGDALTGEVALAEDAPEAFAIVSGAGAFSLAAGETHEVEVSFNPADAGEYEAQLLVQHNATSHAGPSSVSLLGSAEQAAAPSVVVSEAALDLGEVIIFRDASGSFTIENTGNAPLTGSLEIVGDDAADFSLEEGAESFSVEAGTNLEVTVTFAPETTGEKSAELRVTHDAQNLSSPVTVALSGTALINTSAEDMSEVPGDFRLAQNYPNPFNPQTTLAFGLPSAERVRLSVYDLTGRQLNVLVDSVMPAGWHMVNFDASALPSGTYLYHLQAESQTLTRKMTVLK